MIQSVSICVVKNDKIFLWLTSIPFYYVCIMEYIHISHCLYLSISGYLSCSHILAVVSNDAVSVRVHLPFLLLSFFLAMS